MLCFLLQINVMHLKHECQFSLSRRTVATINASNVGTLKTGLQHNGHIFPMGVSRTHKPNIVNVQYVGDGSTQRPNRGGEECQLRQCMTGCIHNHQGQKAVAHYPKPTSSLALQQTGGRNTTHRADSTVHSSPSLTSSFSLLPSYCVGGSANRKLRVSETRRGQWEGQKKQKTARESTFNQSNLTLIQPVALKQCRWQSQ